MWKTSKTCTAICSQIDRGIPFSVYPSSAPHPGRYTSPATPCLVQPSHTWSGPAQPHLVWSSPTTPCLVQPNQRLVWSSPTTPCLVQPNHTLSGPAQPRLVWSSPTTPCLVQLNQPFVWSSPTNGLSGPAQPTACLVQLNQRFVCWLVA